jgi:hypothetical protein
MKYIQLFEDFINEADMSKHYDGFILLDTKNQKLYKSKYFRGNNVTIENDAISKLMKKTGEPRSNYMVHGFVKKGEFNSTEAETI